MRLLIVLLTVVALAGCVEDAGDTGGLQVNDCTRHAMLGQGNPLVTIETSMGNITAEIFVDGAPNTGMNFVKLAENGTYDGSPFHRIIKDFMMQGGDHTRGTGTGGEANPDCADAAGNIPDEYSPELRHDEPGMLSMANAGPGTGSSQFFITFRPTSWLDGYDEDGNLKNCGGTDPMGRPISCHAVFGKVVEGMDVVERVNTEAATPSGQPAKPVTFVSASVAWPGA